MQLKTLARAGGRLFKSSFHVPHPGGTPHFVQLTSLPVLHSKAEKRGHSLYEVQTLLGHTQVKTTQRYAHLAPKTLLDASNAAGVAVGSVMGLMPNRVVDVPLVAVG